MSDVHSLAKQVEVLNRNIAGWNKAYVWALGIALVVGAFSFWAQRQAILASRKLVKTDSELSEEKERQLQRDLKEKDEQIAHTNERAARLEKEAADARLELAKIDPLNLPIRSIKADVFLMVRGDFFEWYFKDDPVLKGGRRTVTVLLASNTGALAILQCNEFESMIWKEEGKPDGRTFQMSFVWPAGDWFSAQEVKYWVDRNNASTAMLDKELIGAVISLPPTKEEKPIEILQSSCRVTINGTIRRNFSVPKSSPKSGIFCPVEQD